MASTNYDISRQTADPERQPRAQADQQSGENENHSDCYSCAAECHAPILRPMRRGLHGEFYSPHYGDSCAGREKKTVRFHRNQAYSGNSFNNSHSRSNTAALVRSVNKADQ